VAVNGLYARGLGANLGMGNEGLFARGLFGVGSGVGDTFEEPPRFRDASFRRRYGGLLAVALILLAGCIQPPRPEVYNPPCLRQDVGQVVRPCPS